MQKSENEFKKERTKSLNANNRRKAEKSFHNFNDLYDNSVFPKLRLRRKNCINMDSVPVTDPLNEALQDFKIDYSDSNYAIKNTNPIFQKCMRENQKTLDARGGRYKQHYKKRTLINLKDKLLHSQTSYERTDFSKVEGQSRNFQKKGEKTAEKFEIVNRSLDHAALAKSVNLRTVKGLKKATKRIKKMKRFSAMLSSKITDEQQKLESEPQEDLQYQGKSIIEARQLLPYINFNYTMYKKQEEE